MAGPITLYFDVWPAATPNSGASLGELTQAREKRIQDVLYGTGMGSFVINRHDAQAAWTATGNLVRVRLVGGGPFAWNSANYKFAFPIEERDEGLLSRDEYAGDDARKSGRGILAYYERLIWWNESFLTPDAVLVREDNWLFPEGDEYGHILQRMVNEWNGRPSPTPIPATMTKDFTQTVDSAAVAWEDISSDYEIPFGENYLATIDDLQATGIEIHMKPDFTLQAWNEDGRGSDKSATHAFRSGWNIRESGSRKIYAPGRASRALVKGKPRDGANYVEATYSQTAADEASALGRREAFVEYERSSVPAFLERAGARVLRRLRRLEEGPPTIGVTSYGQASDGGSPPARQDWIPYTDYDVGDIVALDIDGEYSNAAKRIAELTLYDGPNGEAEVAITFEDGPMRSGSSASRSGNGSAAGGGRCCSKPHSHPPNPGMAPACEANIPGSAIHTWDFEADTNPSFDNETGTIATSITAESNASLCPNGAAVCGWVHSGHGSTSEFPVTASASVEVACDIRWQYGPQGNPAEAAWITWYGGPSDGDREYFISYVGRTTGVTYHISVPLTVPAGATGASIGFRTSAHVDNIVWGTAGSAAVNDPDCFDYGSSPSDSPYGLPSDTIEARLGALAETAADIVYGGWLAWKNPVRIATTAAGTLASSFEAGDTIDGVVLAEGDRILLKNQAAGEANGIYVVNATGAPTRAEDFDSDDEVIAGASVRVLEGTANADKTFGVTTNEPIVLGTTALVFAEISGGGGGGGGHTIEENGTPLTARTGLNFTAGLVAADDAGNDETDVALDDAYVQDLIDDSVTAHVAADHPEAIGLTFIIDGGAATITTGVKGDLHIPFDCTIVAVSMLAEQSGSIVVDIWKDTYANFPPVDADSITASAVPTISATTKSKDTTLTGWTTAISADDTLRYNVDSATTIQRVTVTLWVER